MHLLFIVLSATVVAPSALDVANSGFEKLDQRNGLPSDWSFTSIPGQPKLVRYGVHAVAGDKESRALSISVASDHPERQVAYNAHQDVKGIQAGKSYVVSAKVQTRGLSTLPIVVAQCLDESGSKFLGIARSSDRKLDGDIQAWEQIEAVVKVPDGTSTLRLRIGIPAEGNAGGTAILDDVRITVVE